MTQQNKPEPLVQAANELAKQSDADILIYNGEIRRDWDNDLIELCNARKRRPNVILYLITEGGDPDAAYRIANCLQRKYTKFNIYVSGFCKSAGTIVAIGAHEIIMSDYGELGPLDVQLAKEDELWQYSSGLNIESALQKLQEDSLDSLENYFIPITAKSGGRITTRTAMQIAKDLVIGLYGKIYEQIDPSNIGEVNRASKIAIKYGEILNNLSHNLKDNSLQKLAVAYPEHGFVLDRDQIKELFENVREPNEFERKLTELLGFLSRKPIPLDKSGKRPIILFLSEEVKLENKKENSRDEQKRQTDSGNGNGVKGSSDGGAGTGETRTTEEMPQETHASAQ